MESRNSFDKIPNEVFQLIFAAVADCKSLVRCMVVSKIFKEQASRVTWLSIKCPGQFTSYDQKLRAIHTMIREFPFLESLIVRVGHPKSEPPSWARCMRYAEIGVSVEKFVFMAAKAGDFSEFDHDVGGGDSNVYRNLQVSSNNQTQNAFRDNHEDETSMNPRLELERKNRYDVSNFLFRNQPRQEEDDDEDTRGFDIQTPPMVEENLGTIHDELQPSMFGSEQALMRSFRDNFLLEHRNLRLQDFNLRQVIAPSNDVLKRMVPVIVFAIVQGLDEFRDCVPKFIACFSKLKQFLLVDMVESVTVHMRQSHIEEIRLQGRESEFDKDTCEENALFLNKGDSYLVQRKECNAKKESNVRKKDISDMRIDENKKIEGVGENVNKSLDMMNVLQYHGSKNIEMKIDHRCNKLEFQGDNSENVDGRYDEHNDLNSKGKSLIDYEALNDNIGIENISDNFVKCKRCKNLIALGRSGPCWTCTNKGTRKNVFENLKNPSPNTMMINEMSQKSKYNTFDPNFSLNGDINEYKPQVGHLYSSGDIHSCQLITFNSSFGVPKKIDFQTSSDSSFLKRNMIINNIHIQNLHNINSLETTPLLDVPSSSSEVPNMSQQITTGETMHVSPRGLGRSLSFDSIESLKDKEEHEEIIHLEKERISNERAQKVKNKSMQPHDALRKILVLNIDKRKKLKEKLNEGVSSKLINNDKYSKRMQSLPYKYLLPEASHTNAMKQKEFVQELQNRSFNDTNEFSHCTFQNENIQDIPSTSNLSNIEAHRILQVQKILNDHISNSSKESKDLKNHNIGLWVQGTSIKTENEGINSSKPSTTMFAQSENFEDSNNKEVVDEKMNNTLVDKINIARDLNCNAEIGIPDDISNDVSSNILLQPLNTINDVNHSINDGSENVNPRLDNNQNVFFSVNESEENSCSHEQGSSNEIHRRGRERQRDHVQITRNFGWPIRQRDRSSERLRSASDMRSQREQQAQDEALQLGVPGLEERIAEREMWRETWRERVGRRVREMRHEDHEESERKREVRRERLREGVWKQQREIEREALFFDISFWRAEQISTQSYSLLDVSICIATHGAKPLTPLEINMLSNSALAGPLLVATIAHINKQVNSHNL